MAGEEVAPARAGVDHRCFDWVQAANDVDGRDERGHDMGRRMGRRRDCGARRESEWRGRPRPGPVPSVCFYENSGGELQRWRRTGGVDRGGVTFCIGNDGIRRGRHRHFTGQFNQRVAELESQGLVHVQRAGPIRLF